MRCTVKQLVDALSAFNPELPISVDGYEYGHTQSIRIEQVDLVEHDDVPDYAGELEEPDPRYPKTIRRYVNIGRHDPDEYEDVFPFARKES